MHWKVRKRFRTFTNNNDLPERPIETKELILELVSDEDFG
jgi:hypothetical protein